MEEYRNTVSNLQAIHSQIISNFTSNISKNTSKFTSKTNQIRLWGGHGGAYPSNDASRECVRRVHGGAMGLGPTPKQAQASPRRLLARPLARLLVRPLVRR